jgi:D-alanyl-D-alanine carboxypeptidase
LRQLIVPPEVAVFRRALLVAAAGVLALTACAPSAPPSTAVPTAAPTSAEAATGSASAGFTADQLAQVDAAATAALANGLTGTIVSVVDPERGTILKAYGAADTAGTPLQPDAHYRIASVSKTFTALAVLNLVDEGKVALTDPISRYVADVPNGDAITVRDLLAMRSGLYDFTNDQDFLARYTAEPTMAWTDDDTLAIVRAHAAESTPPNQKTIYNNSDYTLLAYVVAQGSGQSAPEYITGLVRELGLTNTSYPTVDTLPEPFLRGYLGDGASPPPPGGYRDLTVSNPAIAGTAGAMVSTVPDMARYAAQLAGGEGLAPATAAARQEWTPLTDSGVRLQYGLGVTQLGDWVGHDGSIFGYSTMVWHLPSNGATVVVAGNIADAMAVPSQALWGEIVKILYPDTLPTWS